MFDNLKKLVYNIVNRISIADILIIVGILKVIKTLIELNYYIGNICLGLAISGLGYIISLGGE